MPPWMRWYPKVYQGISQLTAFGNPHRPPPIQCRAWFSLQEFGFLCTWGISFSSKEGIKISPARSFYIGTFCRYLTNFHLYNASAEAMGVSGSECWAVVRALALALVNRKRYKMCVDIQSADINTGRLNVNFFTSLSRLARQGSVESLTSTQLHTHIQSYNAISAILRK